MKELSIEQKARAYDDAKARIRRAFNTNRCTIGFMNEIFPEFREDTDERIRKGIIRNLQYLMDKSEGFVKEDLQERIAWLEKQGESAITNIEIPFGANDSELQEVSYNIPEGFNAEIKDDIVVIKKVEPKFHPRDWIVDNCGYVWKIKEIRNQFYLLEGVETDESRPTIEWVNKNFHLWTINDAKDGDVLVSGDVIFIFNNIHGVWVRCHCSLRKDGSFKDRNYDLMYAKDSKEVYPATKEQRDLLFEKMKQEGYEWNSEKKELEKIELKKVESKVRVGDWVILNGTVAQILDKQKNGFVGLDIDGKDFFCNYGHTDSMRLWTINDAKDGDVLVSESTCGLGTWYCIFKSLDGDESMTVYCYLARDWRFETKKELCFDKNPYNTNPATKKQRDLLFQKMKEAGYQWDAEKKELKMIELKKIEPKFKVRDWITDGYIYYKITEILDDRYIIESKYDKRSAILFEYENRYHPWTINDAKDGDVLVTEDYIFIFKDILHGGVHLYCHYNFDDEEFDSDIPDAVIGNIHDKGIHFRPATKEQRDLLFEKMKEAGYEWSDEKKEVKKIEPKIIDPDVLQELNKIKEEIKELKEELKKINNRRRWK